ncbi:MAG TPA: NlpC/P60 family protein [Actinomycetota bacterium]|nr:NlpC/P60 family protein [Actinomycetota bacterium]
MTRTRTRLVGRLTVAVLLAASATIGATTLSSAAPSREEVEQAQARLDDLNRELSLLVEQYDQARLELQRVQARLADVRTQAQRAQATADRATTSLNANAARAYRGVGSQIAQLFDSASLADFSDRLEFIGSMAQADSDLAVEAEAARQEARWTAAELKATSEERQAVVDDLAAKQDEIETRVAEARELFEELDREYHDALAAQAAAQEAAGGSGTGGGGSPIPPPPAPNGNVAAVLQAAYSVIGTPYQWGGASPESGFDCSGFTMWSWAHAGVSLPHSSAAQYSSLPHVAREDLQPGDLLFFYSPISHVAMYVGGGRMIHSSHPGTTVGVVSVYWDSFVGAARPG